MSELTDFIVSLYEMGSDEKAQVESDLLDTFKNSYQTQLQVEANKYGSNKTARPPSGSSLNELKNTAQRDAGSIADTYNRELRSKVEQLYDMNPRGNQRYFAANLDAWSKDRQKFKSQQIAVNTEQVASDMASRDFRDKNRAILGKTYYAYDGAAPVSDECKSRFGAGIVDENFVDEHPTPAHIGCPHKWGQVKVKKLSPADLADLWVG